MKVKTSRFGEIEMRDSDIITFSEGLIGFPELTKFVFLVSPQGSPYNWLQSVDDGGFAFVLTIGRLDCYKEDIPEFAEHEFSVPMCIVTIPTNPKKATANLKAPLMIEFNGGTGKQIILKDLKYGCRHLLSELKK